MSAKKVFISYSHDSPEHSDRVLQFSNALRSHGIDVELDRYQVRPPKGWPHWCEEQLRTENSDFVLMLCTEIYLKRVQDKVPADEGRGVFWEGGIIYDYLYDAKGNTRFVPILFAEGSTDFIPAPVRNHTRYQVKAFELTDVGYQDLYRELTGQPLVTKPPLGEIIKLGAALEATATPLEVRQVKTNFPPIETPGRDFKADISRIIKYAPAELIGREDDLKLLSDAWDKMVRDEKERPLVLTFVALGGEGKTSLVAKWTAQMAYQDWPGCDTAFAWSFYSQGTREQLAASSDLFLKEALNFFGNDDDVEFAASNAGAYEKGQRLARAVGQRRNLLILDGLEPLQYAPTSPTAGELKDGGLAVLLKSIATDSRGLCVVTTRYSIPDLKAFWQTTAPEMKLLRLSREAGVNLLQSLGVSGNLVRNVPFGKEFVNEYEKLVEDVKGHALTLNLLGTYLRDAHGGDIRRRDLVKLSEADAEEQGGHAFRVMEAYERAFEEEGDKGKRALAILRLLGLFDRPMTYDCFGALLHEPPIAALTEPLMGLTDGQLNIALSRLQSAKLITVNRDGGGGLVSIDAHPLLREYFAKQLREIDSHAWREGHRRLYKHLSDSTNEGDEPTLEDLQPLYQAVAHGCQAGLQQETCDEVYAARITRGEEKHVIRKLGAFGSDLGAVACFFDQPWRRVSPALTEAYQAVMLNQAAFRLRALGRLTEAMEPFRSGIEMRIRQKHWAGAATQANNLSELELTLGEVAGAVRDAEQSVTYAERSGNAFLEMGSRTTHADALHQAGRRAEAETRFREAEQIQAERQPANPLLYSLAGFRYCDLLLAAPERAAWQIIFECGDLSPSTAPVRPNVREPPDWGSPLPTSRAGDESPDESPHSKTLREVQERAAQTLQWAELWQKDILSAALDNLTLGRAALYEATLYSGRRREDAHSITRRPSLGNAQDSQSLRQSAATQIDAAVDSLRRSGQSDELPRGLLSRTWLRFLKRDANGAGSDLDEAWEIAERGPMRLFMADIHLYRARLFHGVKPYPWNKFADGSEGREPKDDLEDARKLIEKCGYWRRKEELEDAEEAAKNW